MSNSDLPDNNDKKTKRGRPKKVLVEDAKELIATIEETEKTLDESIHEIILTEIPQENSMDNKLSELLLEIILNDPMLKLSIIDKVNQDVVPKKSSTYTEAHRLAQAKYRAKYPEKYHQLQKKVYEKIKTDEERKPKYDKMNRDSHRRTREKLKEDKIARGETVRPRGRPKKTKTEEPIKTNGDI